MQSAGDGGMGERDISQQMQERMGAMSERMRDIDATVRRVSRERPIAMLVGAVVVGFIIGRLVTR